MVPADAWNGTRDCTPLVSSLQPPASCVNAPQDPVKTARIVSYELPNVFAVSVPLLGAVKRYQTLLPRLWFPQLGAGSLASVVAAVVTIVPE